MFQDDVSKTQQVMGQRLNPKFRKVVQEAVQELKKNHNGSLTSDMYNSLVLESTTPRCNGEIKPPIDLNESLDFYEGSITMLLSQMIMFNDINKEHYGNSNKILANVIAVSCGWLFFVEELLTKKEMELYGGQRPEAPKPPANPEKFNFLKDIIKRRNNNPKE